MIKKFNQYITESQEISEDKVKEMGSSLKETVQTLDQEKSKLTQLVKDLELFVSDKNKNDQIDDSYISLQEVESLISEAIVKIDEITKKMSDYLKHGRQYLY
ncbi:MAG: hypothetical protein SLAVMIC_00200 [uncultured marine phage]|uniref:Uncharacterized protein n=1 Tax=uncultured marine phage TaxID=707152 RepID=A0A8D9C8I3_9VIRU|nr:MAG: hypothetical protein SLAVMIC_00200 [uncultured marine phage]